MMNLTRGLGKYVVLLLALLLVACGNGEGETAVSTDTPIVEPTVVTETAVPQPEPEPAAPEADTSEAEEPTEAVEEPTEPEQPETAVSVVQFQINPAQSEARFLIGEILRGEPFTVVGVTSAVTGELTVDFANPSQTTIGEITVDASTLMTDSSLRDRAINNFVLNTSQHQFIRFTPTSLIGLPDSVDIGQTITFQIEGDLTVRDVTQTVLFDAVVNLVSEQELRGQASTVILYADYNLTIPSVPQVAAVDDDLTLEIEFVATAVQP